MGLLLIRMQAIMKSHQEQRPALGESHRHLYESNLLKDVTGRLNKPRKALLCERTSSRLHLRFLRP
jgi:hypothetical protein